MASIVLSSSKRRMSWTTLGAVLELRSTILAPLAGGAEIDVADRRDAHVLQLAPAGDVVLAPAVDAAHGHPHGVVRPARLGIAVTVIRGQRRPSFPESRPLQPPVWPCPQKTLGEAASAWVGPSWGLGWREAIAR